MNAGNATPRVADHTWAVVVMCFIALNAIELALTLGLVSQGAVEINPIMSAVLGIGWQWATGLKPVTTAGVAAGLWIGRRHQLVRRTGLAFVALFVLLVAYQVIGMSLTG